MCTITFGYPAIQPAAVSCRIIRAAANGPGLLVFCTLIYLLYACLQTMSMTYVFSEGPT